MPEFISRRCLAELPFPPSTCGSARLFTIYIFVACADDKRSWRRDRAGKDCVTSATSGKRIGESDDVIDRDLTRGESTYCGERALYPRYLVFLVSLFFSIICPRRVLPTFSNLFNPRKIESCLKFSLSSFRKDFERNSNFLERIINILAMEY